MRRRNRTLVIPRGTLDGTVTNVVLIPNELEDPNQSLVVRAPALGRSLPITADSQFAWHKAPRFATSFDGTPGYRYQPDHFERDFDLPEGISSPQGIVDDDYYFDMYDSSQDTFVGGESGDLSGSAMERLMAGELNRRSGAEEEEAEATQESLQPPPFMIESPISSFHSSMVDSAGYEPSSEDYIMSHYTPLSQSISVPSASYIWPIPPNCEPCYWSGNFDVCPQTCPIRRGIPFANPNVPAYLPPDDPSLEMGPCIPDSKDRTGPILAGSPPALNRTRPIPPTPYVGQPTPSLDATRRMLSVPRPPLNVTGPRGCPALNTTGPAVNLNRTRPTVPALNRTGPRVSALNRTRPTATNLNQTRPLPPDLDQTRPSRARLLNTTGPVVSPTGSRINLNVTVQLEPNSTPAPPVRSRTRIPVSVNRASAARQRATPRPQPLPPPPPPPVGLTRRQPPRRPRQTPSRGSCNPCAGPAARKPWR